MKVENVSHEQTFEIDQIVTRYLHQLIADLVTHRLRRASKVCDTWATIFAQNLKHITEVGSKQVTMLKLVSYVMRAPDIQAM